MRNLLRSAFVVGRRDFNATVLSKAFLFFLLGPLFPLLLGGLFGEIGARVATSTQTPVVAVVADDFAFDRLAAAQREVSGATMGAIQLKRSEPEADVDAQVSRLLHAKNDPPVAVLTGWPDDPVLAGGLRRDSPQVGQLRLMLALARAPAGAEPATLRVDYERQAAGSVSRSRAITGQIAQMLLFFLTILLSGMLLSQLIEEKSNKIIEVIAAAVRIDALFLGKLFAMLAASVLGIIVWAAAGALAINLLASGGLGALPEPAVGWLPFALLTILYFALNYLLLGAVFLGIGAQASTAREVQIMSMPVTFAQVLIFGFAALSVGSPNSTEAIAAAVFPLSSPLVMIARAAEAPDLWPHTIAIAWQCLWVALILWAGARLFRRTVLKSGAAQPFWRRRKTA